MVASKGELIGSLDLIFIRSDKPTDAADDGSVEVDITNLRSILWQQFGAAIDMLENALVDLRHVQHGAAQLNLILRQTTDSAPRWIAMTRREHAGE